jgi:hypothetical protein
MVRLYVFLVVKKVDHILLIRSTDNTTIHKVNKVRMEGRSGPIEL